jgi:hypothetical protein
MKTLLKKISILLCHIKNVIKNDDINIDDLHVEITTKEFLNDPNRRFMFLNDPNHRVFKKLP